MQPDLVLLILDDVGAADLAAVPTPNIDALAECGMRFDRAYGQAWCMPSRDSLLRGRFKGRARGDLCTAMAPSAIPHETPTLPRAFHDAGYETALVGKWHLGRARSRGLPWYHAPQTLGFDHWLGAIPTSPTGGCLPAGVDYYDDGVEMSAAGQHRLAIERDGVLQALALAQGGGRPLFAQVGFSNAHAPFTVPPANVMPPGYQPPLNPTERDKYEAEIVGLDHVIGELVAALPPETWWIVCGENGTPEQVAPDPTKAKLTCYERGVRIPLILSGPGIAHGTSDALVHLYDLWPTLAGGPPLNLAAPPPDVEGTSFQPVLAGGPFPRPWVYVRHTSSGAPHRAVIEERWKLMELGGAELFYDLANDPGETVALPLLGGDYLRLRAQLDVLPT